MEKVTHATSKFRWFYTFLNGQTEGGNFFTPIGSEGQAEKTFENIVKSELPTNEEFIRSRGKLEEIPNEQVR